jgi:hypothetical protein
MQHALRSLLTASLLLFFAGGCFGDNDGGDAPRILGVEAPQTVDVEGGIAAISVRVKGKPSEELALSFTGDDALGRFEVSVASLATDELGEATFSARFVAGAATGVITSEVRVENAEGARGDAELSLEVTPIQRIGEITQYTLTEPADINYLEGQPITVAEPGTLRRLGIIATGPVDVVVALYADSNDVPGALVATTTATLRAGVNELPVEGVPLPAGTYWFMANYRSSTNLYISSTLRRTVYVPRAFAAQIPATYPYSALNDYDDGIRNYYVVTGR